ncbi:MAG: glycoside hydrolase family 113, partial [Ktedonobacterales bacterium]
KAGADEFSLGNEYIGLEYASDALWNTLIARARAVYPGTITYNTNWSSLDGFARQLPAWLKNPSLAYIGVSCYQSLVDAPRTLSVAQIQQVWRQQFLPRLDALSNATHKPVLISEIGYRNATDALYQPWVHTTGAPADPKLQAAAYEGAVRSALGDHHIQGIFFYAWENGPFAPNDLPAAQVLHTIYLSPDA